MSVIVEVKKLVAPLGDNSERILEKRDDNQESADRGEVSARISCQTRATWLSMDSIGQCDPGYHEE
jgi:hypothetical protein